uniref:Proton pump-interactor 1 n=1 Tax=Leersia perrieri TaxID=77586 RepID=A0A0D9X701_9ORYZ
MAAEEAVCGGGGESQEPELLVKEVPEASPELKELEKHVREGKGEVQEAELPVDEVPSVSPQLKELEKPVSGGEGEVLEAESPVDEAPSVSPKLKELEKPVCGGEGELQEAESSVDEAPSVLPELKELEKPVSGREGEVLEAESPVDEAPSVSPELKELEKAVCGGEGESNAASGHGHEDGVDGNSEAGALMVNGHLHPEVPDCVEEVNDELAAPEITGLIEQEMEGREPEGMGVMMSDLHDHTDTTISESKVSSEDNSIEHDVTELIMQETIIGEQDGSDVSTANGHAHVGKNDDCDASAKNPDVGDGQSTCEQTAGDSVKLVEQDDLDGYVTNGHEHDDTSVDVDVAAAMLDVHGNKSKGQDTAAFVELETATVEHDQADISLTSGHDQVDRNSDSGEAEAKSEVCDCNGKRRESSTDSTEMFRQEAMTGEQGTGNESVDNGFDHPNANADLAEAPTQVMVCSKDSGMVQSAVEGVESVPHERTLKVADQQTEGDANVDNKEVPREEAKITNWYEHVEESAVLEPQIEDGQHDFALVERLDNRTVEEEEILQDTCTSGVDIAAVEADALYVERNGEAALEGTKTKEKHEKTNNEILQVDDFSSDNVECLVQSDELIKADGDTTFQTAEPVSYSMGETEKEEAGGPVYSKEASLVSVQLQTTASFQETEDELSATPGNHIADNSDIEKIDTELKQEPDMEVFDGAQLSAAPNVVSAIHGKIRSSDLTDSDVAEFERSTPACNSGTPSAALTGVSDSNVNSTASVAQVEDDASDEGKIINENLTATVTQVEQDGPSIDDDKIPADGTVDDVCSRNAKACITSCEAQTEYLEDIASTTVDVIHDKQNGDGNIHDDNSNITGDHNESQLEITTDNENREDLQVINPNSICLMKVPKFSSEALWADIQDAQSRLDELTQKRDAINILRKKKRDLCDGYQMQLEAAREQERGARAAHGGKRQDLNSLQSMIGRLNKANSIQDIDAMIEMKEKTITHESISLKDEKQLLQDIKELKAQKKQLYSNMGSRTEMDEAFNNKEHIHEKHKILKKDSDVLLTNLKSLEDKTRFIKKALDDERDALRKLNEEHRAANEIRQKAYDEWFELKKEPGRKNKFFFTYRKDYGTAQEYANKRDVMGLALFCNNQVESLMELWNKDDDFRRQYVESNKNSTLRRLGAPDGRRLGPDEVPPVIPRKFSRMQSDTSRLPVSSRHVSTSASEAMPPKPASSVTTVEEESFPVLQGSQNSKPSKPKVPDNSSSNETPRAPVTQKEDVEKIEKEKKQRMEEDLELARQAAELACREEEIRQEKAAAEKERLRLEQKAKAKEAEERKRRKAEKAQERAEFRARKEAEEKKAKKDRRKGSTSDSVNDNGEGNAEATVANGADPSSTENSREVDNPQHRAPKKRPSVALKQLNKMEPMPLALRNKGRRKMRQYIIVAVVAAFSVLALVMASKYVPSNFRASSS